jgi:hypothetical protein
MLNGIYLNEYFFSNHVPEHRYLKYKYLFKKNCKSIFEKWCCIVVESGGQR